MFYAKTFNFFRQINLTCFIQSKFKTDGNLLSFHQKVGIFSIPGPAPSYQCAKCDIWLRRRQSIWQKKLLAAKHRGLVRGGRCKPPSLPTHLFLPVHASDTNGADVCKTHHFPLPNWLLDYNCANKWYLWLKLLLQIKFDFFTTIEISKSVAGGNLFISK